MPLKLSRLKKWLTLEDAAKYLTLLIGEEATPADLLQLAVQKELILSVNLVKPHFAKTGELISIDDEDLSGPSLRKGSHRELTGNKRHVLRDELPDRALKNYRFVRSSRVVRDPAEANSSTAHPGSSAIKGLNVDHAAYFTGDALPDYGGVLQFDDTRIHNITGLWDLPMVGAESHDIENAFYSSIAEPSVESVKRSGVLLKAPTENRWANLYQRRANKRDGTDPRDFCPCGRLPEGALLVVRRTELQRLAESANEQEGANNTDRERQEYPPRLEALILAWRKYWKNADRTDRSACPKKEDVIAWLMAQGLSAKNADAGATIIKPEWASDMYW